MKRSLTILLAVAGLWTAPFAQPARPLANGLFLGLRADISPGTGDFGWLGTRDTPYLDSLGVTQSYGRQATDEFHIQLGFMAMEGRFKLGLDLHLGSRHRGVEQIPHRMRKPFGIDLQYYVFPLRERSAVPYLGMALHQYHYTHTDPAGRMVRIQPLKAAADLGVRYLHRYGYLQCGLNVLLDRNARILLDRDHVAVMELAPFQVHASAGFHLPYRALQANREPLPPVDQPLPFSEGLYLAGGMAAAMPVHAPLQEQGPFSVLPARPVTPIHTSWAVGYRIPWAGVQLELTKREYSLVRENLGLRHEARRGGWGFWLIIAERDRGWIRPQGGFGYHIDRMQETMTDNSEIIASYTRRFHRFQMRGGLTIHPGTARNDWYLRTQVRYSPFARSGKEEHRIPYDHLEWDMVQLVWHPFRTRWRG